MENRKLKIGNRKSVIALLVSVFWLLAPAFAQQPNPQPVYKANAEAVQGVGPGNWTYGADVNLYVNASTGNDSTGDGTSGSPYATIGRALQDIPKFVSQHYIINLSPGTYYGEVNITGYYFPMQSSFSANSIEIKGNASSPDSYIISGATAGAPTTASSHYAVFASSAHLILNGVSMQYPVQECIRVIGGYTVLNATTLRHEPSSTYWGGLLATANAFIEITGSFVTSDVSESISAYDHAYVIAGGPVEPLNTGFSAPSPITLTSEGSGDDAVDVEFSSTVDLEGTTSMSCTSGASGIVEVSSDYLSETTSISGCATGITGINFGHMEINDLTISSATTGVSLTNGAWLDTYGHTPTFTSVTTPWSIEAGSKATGGFGTLYGSNSVGIGTAHPVAALDVAGAIHSLPVAFSSLPACTSALEGTQQPVMDSSTNTWGAALSGGGSDHVLAYCNGTAWTVAAN